MRLKFQFPLPVSLSWTAAVAILAASAGCTSFDLGESFGGPGVKPQDSGEKMMFFEIDSAAARDFEPDKAHALNLIAAQTSLDPNTQIYLVYKTFKELAFDDDRIEVMRTLIHNPAFCDAARERIKRSLSKLTFDTSRNALAGDLSR
jgi:hypothetical protein